MDLAPLLRQTIAWTPTTGENDRGERTYGATVTVAARAVPKTKDVIKKTGSTVTTARAVTMITEPSVGDHLGGREVVQVAELVDYTGTIVGYQALTQ